MLNALCFYLWCVMVPIPVCNIILNFREDSMVVDIGEPADWVKINVRQTVSSIRIVLFNRIVHAHYRFFFRMIYQKYDIISHS
jgi:hypothetical protein